MRLDHVVSLKGVSETEFLYLAGSIYILMWIVWRICKKRTEYSLPTAYFYSGVCRVGRLLHVGNPLPYRYHPMISIFTTQQLSRQEDLDTYILLRKVRPKIPFFLGNFEKCVTHSPFVRQLSYFPVNIILNSHVNTPHFVHILFMLSPGRMPLDGTSIEVLQFVIIVLQLCQRIVMIFYTALVGIQVVCIAFIPTNHNR